MENITIENLTIVGQAAIKMVGYFWPIIVLAIGYMIWERHEEVKYETK